MNPFEISVSLSELAFQAYDPADFPFKFAHAADNNPGAIAKHWNGSFNKSNLPGGVLMNQADFTSQINLDYQLLYAD